MRKILVVAIVALAAAVPATASAKEIVGLTVCGASGCETERGQTISGALHEGRGGPMGDMGAAVAPGKPGPWYRGHILMGDHGKVYGRMPFYYVPDGALIVLPGMGAQTTTWQNASGAWRDAIARLADAVEPFATPTISRVSINGENAADPQSYLALYSIGGEAKTYPKTMDSVQVVLESKRRTPWTDGNNLILYPQERLLARDGHWVSVSGRIADAVAAHTSLADDGRSFPWLPVAVAAALALLVAAAIVVARVAPARRPEAGTA